MRLVELSIDSVFQICLIDVIYFFVFSLKLSTPSDGDILLDFSKNRINDETLKLLLDLVTNLSCFVIFLLFRVYDIMYHQ